MELGLVHIRAAKADGRWENAYGLISAKKPETRLRRFTKFMNMLDNEEKP